MCVCAILQRRLVVCNYFHNSTVGGYIRVCKCCVVHYLFEGIHHRAAGPGSSSAAVVNLFIHDLVQVHCCVAMMIWQGIELIARH